MTKVVFYKSGDSFWGFDVSGHTGFADSGEDILCSAISSMTMLVINAIEIAYASDVDYEIDDPEAKAAWEEDMKDLQYQKAVIFLKDGKKRQAKKILKALDDEPSRELLDKLLW
jgi:uncharacterized protein YsxB (DUF464 family)